jgi:2,3-bisphosphoglycerate-independent phosphoglycerate mutase
MRSVLVVFLDGVGLGEADPEANPFMRVELRFLQSLLKLPHLVQSAAGSSTDYAALLGTDTTLGVSGLPQSATGQAAILTGINAPKMIGEHSGPYPNAYLRDILAEHSVFKTLVTQGWPVAYANAYPGRFHDRLQRGKGRLSANTQAAVLAGVRLRDATDLKAGNAVNALLTNEFWPEPESDVLLPLASAFQAGQNLGRLANEHRLTFFEFWYSDYLGHKMAREESLITLIRLDNFLAGAFAALNTAESLLVVISDHGNFEDWTTKKHTTNPALTIVTGHKFGSFGAKLRALTDLKPMILSYLEAKG